MTSPHASYLEAIGSIVTGMVACRWKNNIFLNSLYLRVCRAELGMQVTEAAAAAAAAAAAKATTTTGQQATAQQE